MFETQFEAANGEKATTHNTAFQEEFSNFQKDAALRRPGDGSSKGAVGQVATPYSELIDFQGDIRNRIVDVGMEKVQQFMMALPPPRGDSPVMAAANQTAAAFDADPDKKGALAKYASDFEKHIADSDANAKLAATEGAEELRKLEPNRTTVRQSVRADFLAVNKALSDLSAKELQVVAPIAHAYINAEEPADKEKALELLKRANPAIAALAVKFSDNVTANKEIFDTEKKVLGNVEGAARDQMFTRLMYAEALGQGGNEEKAKQLSTEAVKTYGAVASRAGRAENELLSLPPRAPKPETREALWHTLELKGDVNQFKY